MKFKKGDVVYAKVSHILGITKNRLYIIEGYGIPSNNIPVVSVNGFFFMENIFGLLDDLSELERLLLE